jgi:hypothetical protein
MVAELNVRCFKIVDRLLSRQDVAELGRLACWFCLLLSIGSLIVGCRRNFVNIKLLVSRQFVVVKGCLQFL